jgi:KipI family sensor histidine kinase inhibitor
VTDRTLPSEAPRILRCGATALLVELGSLEAVIALRLHLDGSPIDGVVEMVSAFSTLLVRYNPFLVTEQRLRELLSQTVPVAESVGKPSADIVEIPVIYDGEDLESVAAITGLGVAGVIREHTGQVWTSAFCGFSPGFSYLVAPSRRLEVARHTNSRTLVPAGSVGLAAGFSGVYPRSSPGGWQLIGHTEVSMWSLNRLPPALAPAGTLVRFVDAGHCHA